MRNVSITEEADQRFVPGRWLLIALCLSLLIHACLYFYFHFVDMGFNKPKIDPIQPARFHVERASIDPNKLEPLPPKPTGSGGTDQREQPMAILPDKIEAFDGPLKAPSIPAPRMPEQKEVSISAGAVKAPENAFSALPVVASGKIPQVAQALANQASTAALASANAALGQSNIASGGGNGSSTVPGFGEIASLTDLRAPGTVGRPAAQPILIRLSSDVLFEFDSAQIKVSAEESLNRIAEALSKATMAKITVEGYTDTFGTDDYNQKLSEDRAHAVAVFLQERTGLDPTHITWRGYGKSHPIVNPLGTVEQQALNRRVEIRVEGQR